MFTIVSAIILLSHSLEIIRFSHGRELSLTLILKLVFMKYPYLLQRTIPFLILFGSIFTFLHLSRTFELVVIRASGISVWQFLTPVFITAITIGVFVLTILNPLSATLLNKQEKIAHKYLRGESNTIAVANGGMWLKEQTPEHKLIIHAKHIQSKDIILRDLTFFIFNLDNLFEKRISAELAQLSNGYWHLQKAKVFTAGNLPAQHEHLQIKTTLVAAKIQDSFASPETISFWELPGFISILKKAGFSALRHSSYFYSLLFQPIYLSAMVLIAASFSLRLPRRGNLVSMVVIGIIIGFFVYFFIDLVGVLGMTGKVPVILATLAPIIITMLFSIALILHLEDG